MFIKEHDTYYPHPSSSVFPKQVKELPAGYYLVQKHEWRGFQLREHNVLSTLPEKRYGDVDTYVSRYIQTFQERPNSTGILLSGIQGGGKTLTAKLLCEALALPTLLITEYFHGAEFKQFLADITTPTVVLFDEFEKVYDDEIKQNELLSVLDGLNSGKKLFLFTSNTPDLNRYLLNRPGRIYYHQQFQGLSKEHIEEIISDTLQDTNQIEPTVELAQALGCISVDSLMAIVEEMNRYKLTASEAVQCLNVNIVEGTYDVTILINGGHYTGYLQGHPLKYANYTITYEKPDERYTHWKHPEQYNIVLADMVISYDDQHTIQMQHKKEATQIMFQRRGGVALHNL